MPFRPKYCANCGEKIERVDWGLFTSRRFCPVCESEFKGQDLIPRVIVGLGLLIGIFGFGSYLKSGTVTSNSLAMRQPAKIAEKQPPANMANLQSAIVDQATPQTTDSRSTMTKPVTLAAQPALNAARRNASEKDGPSYYCGAETKKGTPCTRRVKGNIRCYQHQGMPAMLPAEKLKIG